MNGNNIIEVRLNNIQIGDEISILKRNQKNATCELIDYMNGYLEKITDKTIVIRFNNHGNFSKKTVNKETIVNICKVYNN